jgi:8-oxo-dGTP pyrophosphatase MutT (NUDIX family)
MSFIVKGKKRIRVASVAVINDGRILMGQRRDNNRWTLPGGHIEHGETSLVGGQRELLEETGIGLTPNKFKSIGYSDVLSYPDNKPIRVYAFKVKYNGPTTMQNDPDGEVKRWHWFDMKNIPEKVMKNMHVKGKNVVFDKLGIDQKFVIKKSMDKKKLAKEHKRLVHVLRTPDHKDDLKEAKIQEKELKEEYSKSFKFVINLIKSAQHKYIRKFRKGGKWVYVYYEAKGRPGRVMDEGAASKVSRLEELGKNIAHAHEDEHIRILRELASRGHQKSKEYLDHHQIPHEHDEETSGQAEEETTSTVEAEETDELKEELGLPAMNDNPLEDGFENDEKKGEWLDLVDKALKDGLTNHLFNSYPDSPVTRKLEEIYNGHAPMLAEIVNNANSPADILRNLQRVSKEVRDHLKGTRSQSHSGELGAGAYGNKLFDDFMNRSTRRNRLLPEGFDEVFKIDTEEMPNPDKIEEERQAAEAERQRQLEERRAGITNTMAYAMMNVYKHRSSNDERMLDDAVKLDEKLTKMFGKEMKKEDWPYDFSEHGIKVELSSLDFGRDSISMSMNAYDANGKPITSRWDRKWHGGVDESKTEIYNSYLIVHSDQRGKNPIGTLVNMAQLDFLKKHAPDNGQIKVYAALDVGGYNWANQGFAFESNSTLSSYRSQFQRFLRAKGISLSDEEMRHFKLPSHFAAFHDGKYYESRGSAPLNKKQKEFGNLEGKEGGATPLTDQEIRNGKTRRFHLGKAFLLGEGWQGVMKAKDMVEGNEQYDHFRNYSQLKLDAWQALSPQYQETVRATQSGDRSRSTSSRSEATPTRGSPSSGSANTRMAERAIRNWPVPAGRRNVTINDARIRRMGRWSEEDFDHFIRNARLTADGRARVRAKKREVHG